jgi:Uncharacterized conserved protein (COG2071)
LVEFRVTVRNLLFVSWDVPPDELARKVPDGLEPELADGRAVVTMSFARACAPRLARVRVPGFAKYTLHTYVRRGDESGLCFLDMRVSYRALAGPALGLPTRTTWMRVRAGCAEVPGLRAAFRYRRAGPAEPPRLESGPLGAHDLAFFEAAGLRRLHAPHDEIRWEAAELVAPPRFDPMLAAGFDVTAPSSMLYADRVGFRADLPPGRA